MLYLTNEWTQLVVDATSEWHQLVQRGSLSWLRSDLNSLFTDNDMRQCGAPENCTDFKTSQNRLSKTNGIKNSVRGVIPE